MDRLSYSVSDLLERGAMEQPPELRQLFHRLNNQLGIILAHAELMEKKAADETSRSRATQVVSSVLDAMGTAREIRMQLGTEPRKPDVRLRVGKADARTFQTGTAALSARSPLFHFHLHRLPPDCCIWHVQNCNLRHPKL